MIHDINNKYHNSYCIYCSFKLMYPNYKINNSNINYIIKLSNLFNFNKLKQFNHLYTLTSISKEKVINKLNIINDNALIPNIFYQHFILDYHKNNFEYQYILNIIKLLSKLNNEQIIIDINYIYLNCLYNIKNK